MVGYLLTISPVVMCIVFYDLHWLTAACGFFGCGFMVGLAAIQDWRASRHARNMHENHLMMFRAAEMATEMSSVVNYIHEREPGMVKEAMEHIAAQTHEQMVEQLNQTAERLGAELGG